MTWILLGLAAVCGLLVAESAGNRPAIAFCKLTAAGSFVAFALALGALDWPYGRVLLGGLGLCALGDALLLPRGRTAWFKAGILAFLCGHLAYSVAFFSRGPDGSAALGAGALLLPAGFVAYRWMKPGVPADLGGAVVAYLAVIGAMVATAIGASAAGASPAIAIGAVAFAASDLSVARERFVAPGFVNSAWGLPLYFGAQWVLASTVAPGR